MFRFTLIAPLCVFAIIVSDTSLAENPLSSSPRSGRLLETFKQNLQKGNDPKKAILEFVREMNDLEPGILDGSATDNTFAPFTVRQELARSLANPKTMNEAMTDILRIKYKLPGDSPVLERLSTQFATAAPPKKASSDTPQTYKIYKSYGEHPLSKKATESRAPKEKISLIQTLSKKMKEARVTPGRKNHHAKRYRALMTPKAIPTCDFSERKVVGKLIKRLPQTKERKHIKLELKHTSFDLLLIPSHSPADLLRDKPFLKEAFGKKTIIHTFSTKMADLLSLEASRKGVRCLPVRFQIQGNQRVLLYGEEALKNFDNKKVKGVFHPEVRRRLYEFL